MPTYSIISSSRLRTCDFKIQRIFDAVIIYRDCSILEGHRGEQVQNEHFEAGRSEAKWPDGKHNSQPSEAIDAAPYPIPPNWGADHWKDLVKFYEFAAVVRYEAAHLGIKIRWGGDWDGDGDYKDQTFDDLVHFELVS